MDKTSGVLSFNNEIRNAHLQRNIGKYSQYKDELSPAIGDYYEIYTRPLKSLTEGKSLMAFTHDGTSEYSARINHNYLNDDLAGHHIYENNKPAFTNFWSGDFYNYLDYVMAVYGHETVPIQFIDGILSLNFMDKALELVEPGIVRDISPIASLAGVVKTNINNFSGTDTRLGLISNQMYAKSLVIGSLFNSDRERTDSFKASVITPSLITKYGNNEYNINKLPNLILPNHGDGRIVEDYNNDVYIFDDYNEIVNLNTVRISDALKKNVNQPYISWTGSVYAKGTGNYYNPLEKYYYVNYTDEVIKTDERGKYINMRTVDTDEFQNGDKRQRYNGNSEQYDGEMVHIMYEDEGGKLLLDADNEFDSFTSVVDKKNLNKKSLLYKTNEIFKDHKIHTIYGEHPVNLPFGMGNFVSTADTETSTIDTAKTGVGRSRGKNLLKKKPNNSSTNGYDNPFCRVWTYHNQYDKVNKLVRPFTKDNGTAYDLREVQAMNNNHRAFIKHGAIAEALNLDGGEYLADNTVLRKTGYVNITPSSTDPTDKVDIKKCMFSIENLAWKDVPDRPENLSKEQRGPHGGRIMWFPPYDLNFQENVNVNWDSNTFIGRGEKIYTYTNTERTGTLSFTLLMDHPSILNDLHNEAGQENPSYYDSEDAEDKVQDMEGDILRFFAGCKPLKYKTKKVELKEEKRGEEEEKGDEIKTVKIYVFYPNNYSGHLFKTTKNSAEDKTNDADIDFAKYLICGTNTGISEDDFIGYEMYPDKNYGISDLNNDDDVIPACNKVESYKECKEVYKGSDLEKRLFRYRVDFDLRQKGLVYDNYNDTKSFGLNLDVNSVKNEQLGNKKDADYSFAEFYYAIENLKKSLNRTDVDEEGMSHIEFLLKQLGTENKLDEICNIFTEDCVFEEIIVHGGATKQDPNNSNKLADRRAGALRWYIRDAYQKRLASEKESDKFDIRVGDYDVPEVNGYSKHDINSVKPKSERYAVIEVKYKVSGSQKLSETDSNTSQKEDAIKHADAIKKMYNVMVGVSEVLKRYNDSGEVTEQGFVTWFETAERQGIKYNEVFQDDYIEKHSSELEDNYVLYWMINDYCESVYKKQNVVEGDVVDGAIGYSKNINLSDSMTNNSLNSEFLELVDKVHTIEVNAINSKITDITNDKENYDQKLESYNQLVENISTLRNKIREECNKLNNYDYGSSQYNTLITNISGYISDRNDSISDLETVANELLESQNTLIKDLEILERMCITSSGTSKERIDKLHVEIDALNEQIVAIDSQILDEELKIEKQENEHLDVYISTALNTNNTSKINYTKSEINKLIQEKDKLISDRNEIVIKKQNKEEELTTLLKQIFNEIKIVNTHVSTVGDVMYLFNRMLPLFETDDKSLYNNLINTNSSTWKRDEEIFNRIELSYSSKFNNLVSGFIINETTTPEDKNITFWTMYAIQLLIQWIELEVCKQNPEKSSDDLIESVKQVLKSMDTESSDELVYLITLLVAKTRINDEPEKRFNIYGILSDIVDIKNITENNYAFPETNKFIESNAPTQEMANSAVIELTHVLNARAEGYRNEANQNMLADGQTPESGNFIISENNGEPEETEVEDSAANDVLLLDVASYRENGHRYETESEYFSKLKDSDPIIFKQIKDKIKYFDPAFHSMSPEGFNARLTFLQQCTRQGHTVELQTSNTPGAPTAGNLAFGRMPICVLRIGDFIYSKIIINSMSISYGDGGMQWDLNPEGAGVQPMMAKISMPITILGGQSLEGPINRLQNAVTFNYYANTGVYDNRSDRAKPVFEFNEEIQTSDKDTKSQTVETSEAVASENKPISDNKTSGKYRTDHYYTWNPMNSK